MNNRSKTSLSTEETVPFFVINPTELTAEGEEQVLLALSHLSFAKVLKIKLFFIYMPP